MADLLDGRRWAVNRVPDSTAMNAGPTAYLKSGERADRPGLDREPEVGPASALLLGDAQQRIVHPLRLAGVERPDQVLAARGGPPCHLN